MRKDEQLRRQRAKLGYRMLLVAAVLVPIWAVISMFMALSSGFCGDWGDTATCDAQAAGYRRTAITGTVLLLGFIVAGVAVIARNQADPGPPPASTPSPSPARVTRAASTTRQPPERWNHKAVAALVLAVLTWTPAAIDDTTSSGLLVEFLVIVVAPLPSLVVAWRASTEISESNGRQRGRGLARAAVAITCLAIFVAAVAVFG